MIESNYDGFYNMVIISEPEPVSDAQRIRELESQVAKLKAEIARLRGIIEDNEIEDL
jgi:TolA-binding protein